MASMVFAISASANFPLLILAVYWRGLTSRGALAGGAVGLVSSVLLMVLGPTVWVEILGNERPIFPYQYPALFSMTGCFLVTGLVSTWDRSAGGSADRARFEQIFQDDSRWIPEREPVDGRRGLGHNAASICLRRH